MFARAVSGSTGAVKDESHGTTVNQLDNASGSCNLVGTDAAVAGTFETGPGMNNPVACEQQTERRRVMSMH